MTILGIVACVAVNKTGVISLQRKGAFCSWQLIDGVHSELAQKGNSDSRRLSLLPFWYNKCRMQYSDKTLKYYNKIFKILTN